MPARRRWATATARAERWLATTVGVAALGVAATGDVAGAGVVVAVGVVGWWVAWRGWLAEVDTVSELIDTDLGDRRLPADLPGLAGRFARQINQRADDARAAEEAGRRAIERTAQIIDAAPSGVAVIGSDGRIEHVNEAMRVLLQLRSEPVGLLPVEALRAPEVLEAIDEAERHGQAGERPFSQGERDLTVSVHAMPQGMLAVVRDVSGERRVERARTDFVANVSHELRTPIAAILGFAETLLATPDLDPEVARMATIIHRNAERQRQLFEDLLMLHQIEARRQEPPREAVAMDDVLAQAVVPAADAASAKGIAFEVDCPDGLEVWVNPQALAAIVGNLASNACKYTPAGGTVRVVARMDRDAVRVDVSDTGVGIPRAAQARVFERFYRVDEGRDRAVGGTGLGLAIVKHLAQAIGARVTVDSEQGTGSTFSVHLPRVARSKATRTWEDTLSR